MKSAFWSNMSYTIRKAVKYNKRLITYTCIYTISSFVLSILILYFPKIVIDEVMEVRDISKLILVLLFFLITASALSYVVNFLKNRTYSEFHEFRCFCLQEYQQKCFELELNKVESPDALNKINMAKICLYDNDKGFEGVLRKLFSLIGSIITILYYGVIIVRFNFALFLLLVVNAAIPYLASYQAKKYEYIKQEEVSALNRKQGYITDIMSDFAYGKEIRLYNMKNILVKMSDDLNHQELKLDKKIMNRRLMVDIANLVITFIREWAVYIYLIFMILNGKLTIGDFALYTGVFISFSSLLTEIVDGINHVRVQSFLISDYRKFMDMSMENNKEELHLDCTKGCTIDFENVSFSYPGSERKLFKNLNVHIDASEKVAIVGGNGAGKSTFVKLMCGFYKPDAGRILLNGKDIALYSRDSVLAYFSVLFQDISFFSLTIAENVALQSGEKLDDEKVEECIKKVGLMDKMHSLPKGIKTTLTKNLDPDGTELSGGEKQKLAMARMIYKNSYVYILDEPTSALDPLAEEAIYEKLNELTNGKTSLYITHRLMSTRFCDRILVLQDGKIVEEGNHEELMKREGVYHEMFNLQASYYQKGEENG